MGQDKALLEVQGEPMASRVARALSVAGAGQVVAVGGDAAALDALGLAWVADEWPGDGPLGGIVTALGHLRHDIVFVASCDLLVPAPEAMGQTVDTLAARPAADLAVPMRDETPQWLHGAWRRGVVDALTEQLSNGERAVHRAVQAAGLAVTHVENLDPAALQDANTPDDVL